MNILGAILLIVGAASALALYLGKAPDALLNLGLTWPMWLGVSVAGSVVLYFNRRPGD